MSQTTSLNSKTSSIKAVVFDMDGVLVNTSPCHQLAYQRTWLNWNIDGPDYGEIAGRSTRNVVAEYGKNLSPDEQRQCIEFKQRKALELLKCEDIIFDDTFEILHALTAAKFGLALATSASLAGTQLVLDRLQVKSLFNCVVTAEDVEQAKPAPDLFSKAIDMMNLQPEQTLVVEDSEAGVVAGLNAGSWVVSVRESSTKETALTIKHERYLGHFDNLYDMYQQLFKAPV